MHELVHTSIPKGLFGGTGYAVAAATRDMPESLRLALQGISNLEDSTPGVTWSARVVNASGGPWLVLSRQQPAPADHTGRSNYIAHHVALSFATDARVDPASILKNHPWQTEWTGEARWLHSPTAPAPLPRESRADRWKRQGFDPGWAGHLAADHASPVPVLYPLAILDPLPLIIEALCLLPVADRWQVPFNTRATSVTRSPGWWWARVDSPVATQFRRQPGLVDLTTPSQAPDDHPLVWQARGQKPPETFSLHRPSSTTRAPVRARRPQEEDTTQPAIPARPTRTWLAIAGAGIGGLLLGLLPAVFLVSRANSLAAIAAAAQAESSKELADLKKVQEHAAGDKALADKNCQAKLDKQKADHDKDLQAARNEADQAFEQARILNTLKDWDTTLADLTQSLKTKANLNDADIRKITDSKLVSRLGKAPPQTKPIDSVPDAIGLAKGQPVSLGESLQASLASAADVAKKPTLIDQALTDPKSSPKLILLDPKDIPAISRALSKGRKTLSETLVAIEKSPANDPVPVFATPGEWRNWLNNERSTAQGERLNGDLVWKSLLGKNLADSVWVNIGQVRKMFASIRGFTGAKGRKMEPKVATPFNLLKDVTQILRDDEGRPQALAKALADKPLRDKLITALGQLDTRLDRALELFVDEVVPPQPVWLLHDDIRLAREHLQVLDKAIPKIANIPPEDREKLVQLTRKTYKRLGELGEHNLENWLKENRKD